MAQFAVISQQNIIDIMFDSITLIDL